MNFTDRTALVTGSGSGIGRAIALLLAQTGANVVVNDVSRDDAQATVEKIQSSGRTAISACADVVSWTSW